MALHAATARYHHAALGKEAPDSAWFREHGIKSPARMAAMIAPGFA
jgi:hypothetical protein